MLSEPLLVVTRLARAFDHLAIRYRDSPFARAQRPAEESVGSPRLC
jgi:hypothetical protein